MGTFRVYYDPAALEELCRRTPYNLKKDLKNIDEQTRQEIAEELANEIYLGWTVHRLRSPFIGAESDRLPVLRLGSWMSGVTQESQMATGASCWSIMCTAVRFCCTFTGMRMEKRRTSVGATGISWTDWSMNTSALWRPYRQKKSHKNRKTVWEEVYHDRYQ